MGDALAVFTARFFCGCVHLVVWIDDWEEAYHTLRRVVKEYLLLEEEDGENKNRASPDNTFTGFYLFASLNQH